MNTTLTLVLYMAIVTWALVVVASLIRAQAWTLSGLMVAFGNRENLSEATPFAGRAERTARNTLDNFVLFAAIALAAHALSPANPQVAQGAQVFFIARLVYIPVYYVGLKFVRTTVWTISLVGLGMMLAAVL